MAKSNPKSEFAERITWPLSLWAFAGAMVLSIFLTFWAPSQFLRLRGPDADPAAFNASRYWVKTGVKVELKDKADPTPYWLISSRKPKALAKCL